MGCHWLAGTSSEGINGHVIVTSYQKLEQDLKAWLLAPVRLHTGLTDGVGEKPVKTWIVQEGSHLTGGFQL